MNIWHPAPRGLINAAATIRWTRKHTAPDLVVYLWIWSQQDDGAPPTRRQVAAIFGWTEHQARKMIAQVKQDRNDWLRLTSPTSTPGRRPTMPNDYRQLEHPARQVSTKKRHDSPDRARVSTQQPQHTTQTDSELEAAWQAIK